MKATILAMTTLALTACSGCGEEVSPDGVLGFGDHVVPDYVLFGGLGVFNKSQAPVAPAELEQAIGLVLGEAYRLRPEWPTGSLEASFAKRDVWLSINHKGCDSPGHDESYNGCFDMAWPEIDVKLDDASCAVASHGVLAHEFWHYILWVKTGDADSSHANHEAFGPSGAAYRTAQMIKREVCDE